MNRNEKDRREQQENAEVRDIREQTESDEPSIIEVIGPKIEERPPLRFRKNGSSIRREDFDGPSGIGSKLEHSKTKKFKDIKTIIIFLVIIIIISESIIIYSLLSKTANLQYDLINAEKKIKTMEIDTFLSGIKLEEKDKVKLGDNQTIKLQWLSELPENYKKFKVDIILKTKKDGDVLGQLNTTIGYLFYTEFSPKISGEYETLLKITNGEVVVEKSYSWLAVS